MARGTLVTELYPPELGARSDVLLHVVQQKALDADNTSNIIVRDGFIVPRPGLLRLGTTTLTGRPMGGFYFAPTTASRIPVIATASKFYRYTSGTDTWDDITGSITVGGSGDQHSRFAVFPQGGTTYLLAVNGNGHDLCEYTGTGNFTDTAGQAYRADDITVAANRIVLIHTYESGTEQPYRVRWCNFNDRTTWNATNFADLSDTSDPLVCGRALTRVAFAFYGRETQWIAQAQAGSFPFKFEAQDFKPGPVSTAALITREGRHYYMARDKSFYSFDGIRATHIGGPIRRYVERTVGDLEKDRAFAVYSRRDRTIYWVFPTQTSSDPSTGVAFQIDSGQWWPVTFSASVSCGFEWDIVSSITWDSLTGTWDTISATYSTWDSFGSASQQAEILGGTDGKVYRFGVDVTDNGTAFTATWRYAGLQPAGASHRTRVQSLDTFFAKTSTPLTVTTKVGTTDTLAQAPTFPAGLTDTFNVGLDEVHQAKYDTDAAGYGTGTPEARFLSVHHEVSTSIDWKWAGAHLCSVPEQSD